MAKEDLSNIDNDNEVNLIDIFFILWKRKMMIIGITVVAAVISILLSVISMKLPPEDSFLPNVYTAQAFLLVDDKSLGGGGFAPTGDLGTMGSLASIAGVSLGGRASYAQLAIFLVTSNPLLDAIVDEFNLIEKYEIKRSPKGASRRILRDKLKARADERTSGVITISFTDKDPVFARDIVNFALEQLENHFEKLGLDKSFIEKENLENNIANAFDEVRQLEQELRNLERMFSQSPLASFHTGPTIIEETNRISLELSTKRQVYTQLNIRLEMLNISLASEKKVVQILSEAEVSDLKSGPSRALFCLIATASACLFALVLAFAMNAVSNIKKNTEFMDKLRERS